MSTILITNDDGIDSPTLVPLVRALAALGPAVGVDSAGPPPFGSLHCSKSDRPLTTVRVVVPATERSWIAKAITRFEVIEAQATERDGVAMHAVTGSPADCVNLGVHTLYPDPPDLVVSGINLGLNFGLAFLLSSGTIGGTFESWIAGVPAIAFSMAIPNDAYGLTGARRIAALGRRPEAAAEVAADIVGTLLRHTMPAGVDCVSVNMPADVTVETPRVIARVTRSRYGPLFVPGPESGFLHRFQSLRALESLDDGDMQVVQRGAVAITPLRLDFSAAVPAAWRATLERR